MMEPKKPSRNKGEKPPRNEADWTNHENDDGAGRQDEPGDSFDNPQDWPQEGAGDDQGGGAW
jgi:hypothetical protein